MYGEQIKKYPVDSDFWYKKAEKQTLETLPDFIKEIREVFQAYDEFPNYNQEGWYGSDEQSLGYRNCMISGVLCMIATKEAISKRYGWSCNQAGVVRNTVSKAFFRETYEDLNRL